jgi:hypothetical protein
MGHQSCTKSELAQDDPKRLMEALSGLKSYASELCEGCELTVQKLFNASIAPRSHLLLPDFTDQERTLRRTVEKLVSLLSLYQVPLMRT